MMSIFFIISYVQLAGRCTKGVKLHKKIIILFEINKMEKIFARLPLAKKNGERKFALPVYITNVVRVITWYQKRKLNADLKS